MEKGMIDQSEIETLNDWAGFLSFKPNFISEALSQCTSKIVFVDKGNQGGGTADISYDVVLRTLGLHPIEKRNMRPHVAVRTMRFASETLPNDSEGEGEVRNTIYPALKKWLPPSLIKRDITARRAAMTIKDIQGGNDITWEFVSYFQTTQSQAGVQRFLIVEDEEAPEKFHREQLPRLMAATSYGYGGDVYISLTPAEHLTWTFAEIYDRRRITYNSPTIIKYFLEKYGEKHETIEKTDSASDIAVIRAASDDNPTISQEAIELIMSLCSDPEEVEIRRYGIFHQISGRIFKDFDFNIHRISRDKYFSDGIPYGWFHARAIDFHEQTPWAITWVALSNQNEVFIYQEFEPSPEKLVTLEIANQVAMRSGDYRFKMNLIDPLAEKKQPNTGLSARDDLNRIFNELKREGIGTGGTWETWDTKSTRGRDIVKERLKNSRLCGRPFNNRMTKNGLEMYLPTIWILDNCPKFINSFKNWAWDEWAGIGKSLTKDEKNKPQQKYSHFPMTIEALFKHPGFSVGRYNTTVLPERKSGYENMVRGRI